MKKLNDEQLKMLANIIAGIGHGCFASSFVPFLIGLEQSKIVVVLLLLASIGCWIIAIIVLGLKDK